MVSLAVATQQHVSFYCFSCYSDTATAWTKAFKAATNKYSVGQYANIIEPDGTPSEVCITLNAMT